MNLVEKLLKADLKKTEELETKVIKSKRLAKVLGEKDPVEITIQEITAKRMNDLIAYQYDKSGKFDISKSFDANALALVEGLVNPEIKDEQLRKHFNCATPKDLAIKLFGNEVSIIGDEIIKLSGVGASDEDAEIKN